MQREKAVGGWRGWGGGCVAREGSGRIVERQDCGGRREEKERKGRRGREESRHSDRQTVTETDRGDGGWGGGVGGGNRQEGEGGGGIIRNLTKGDYFVIFMAV